MDKIICLGKNYHEHMLELGDKIVDEPVIFIKPASVLKTCTSWDKQLEVALIDDEVHYECELVIRLDKGGYKMTTKQAVGAIGAYTLGLDMTLRNTQKLLKKDGHPWTISKVFPDAAIIGPWIETKAIDFLDIPFSFTLDGELKQSGCGNEMLFKPVELVAYASRFFELCPGDILFTGTPAGIGAVGSNSVGELALGSHKYQVRWVPQLSK